VILCLGSAADRTFIHTLEALAQSGAAFDAIDLGQLAYSGTLEIPLDTPAAATIELHSRRYSLGSYHSAYLRLPPLIEEAPEERLAHRAMAQYRALTQLLQAASMFLVNPPIGDVSNGSKLLHALSLAPVAGFRIPRSCVTRSSEQARAFVASCPSGAIYKGASGTKTWARAYDADQDDGRLAMLEECPVLFQERIVGPDVRIHVVGERNFAELIDSPELDYRAARGNRFRPIEPPPDIAAGCLALARECGKPFLGCDFKLDRATGEWFFLEANPQPGYDYYDARAGGAIARALVELLVDPPERMERRPEGMSGTATGAPIGAPPREGTSTNRRGPLLTVDPEVWSEELDDELIVYDQRRGRAYVLNPTAALVWELCDGSGDADSVAHTLAQGYGRPYEETVGDVQQFVRQMDEAGLLLSASAAQGHAAGSDDAIATAARRFRALTAASRS
jgi:hypothetical protein